MKSELSSSSPLLVVDEVSKGYRQSGLALSDLSFKINSGEKVALLGINGAGKTTTFKTITGLLRPDSGRVFVDGFHVAKSPEKSQEHLAWLSENAPLYPELTPKEFLNFLLRFYRLDRAKNRLDEMVELCELKEVLDKPIGRLSRGFRQRVALASVLIGDAKLILLDEPTTGLDPHQVEHFRLMIRKISEQRSLLMSTHILSEAETVCNRCIIIHKGRVVHDTPLPMDSSKIWKVQYKNKQNLPEPLKIISTKKISEAWSESEIELASIDHAVKTLSQIIEAGVELREFKHHTPGLESLFLEATTGDSIK